LSKGHGEELLPAGKLFGVAVATVTRNTATELAIRKKVNQLGEDALASFIPSSWAIRQEAGMHFKSRQEKYAYNVPVLYRLRDQKHNFYRTAVILQSHLHCLRCSFVVCEARS